MPLAHAAVARNINIVVVVKNFSEYSNKFAIVFTIIYLGMVAEENKLGTKLGKRIKRLGIHQVLYDR